jgi:hypothetical protein
MERILVGCSPAGDGEGWWLGEEESGEGDAGEGARRRHCCSTCSAALGSKKGRRFQNGFSLLSLVCSVALGLCLARSSSGNLFIVAGTHIFQIIDFKKE